MRFLRIDFLINDKLTQERELLSDLMDAPAPFSHDNNSLSCCVLDVVTMWKKAGLKFNPAFLLSY